MKIAWEGGHQSTFSGEQLRWACPCAECRGEGGSTGRLARVKSLAPDELRIQDVSLVGQYAISIDWSDGHKSVWHGR